MIWLSQSLYLNPTWESVGRAQLSFRERISIDFCVTNNNRVEIVKPFGQSIRCVNNRHEKTPPVLPRCWVELRIQSSLFLRSQWHHQHPCRHPLSSHPNDTAAGSQRCDHQCDCHPAASASLCMWHSTSSTSKYCSIKPLKQNSLEPNFGLTSSLVPSPPGWDNSEWSNRRPADCSNLNVFLRHTQKAFSGLIRLGV